MKGIIIVSALTLRSPWVRHHRSQCDFSQPGILGGESQKFGDIFVVLVAVSIVGKCVGEWSVSFVPRKTLPVRRQ